MSSVNDMVRQFFIAAGVDFPPPVGGFGGGAGGGIGGGGGGGFAAAPQVDPVTGLPLTGTRKALFYNDRTGVIFARATLVDLDVMDKAIQVLNIAPPQVMIEAKFVEIGQSDTKMLGFDWLLGNTLMYGGAIGFQGGTAPAFAGSPSKANPSGIFPGLRSGCRASGYRPWRAHLSSYGDRPKIDEQPPEQHSRYPNARPGFGDPHGHFD